jgi:hypothetical protein
MTEKEAEAAGAVRKVNRSLYLLLPKPIAMADKIGVETRYRIFHSVSPSGKPVLSYEFEVKP